MPTSVPPSSGVERKRHSGYRSKKQYQQKHCGKQGKQPSNKPGSRPPLPFFRLLMVWGILVGGSLSIAVNLYRLQISQASYLLQQARKQQLVYLRPYIPVAQW